MSSIHENHRSSQSQSQTMMTKSRQWKKVQRVLLALLLLGTSSLILSKRIAAITTVDDDDDNNHDEHRSPQQQTESWSSVAKNSTNQNTFNDAEDNGVPSKRTLYSVARPESTDDSLYEMLLAHAYAWNQSVSYGGACIDAPNNDHPINHQASQAVLQALGGTAILPHWSNCSSMMEIIPRKEYARLNTKLWTPAWLDSFRSAMNLNPIRLQPQQQQHNSHVVRVAVDARRQAFHPCLKTRSRRNLYYLPNDYYLNVLDHYLPMELDKRSSLQTQHFDVEIVIFSEPRPVELLDVFRDRNYSIRVVESDNEQAIVKAWKYMVTADLLVLSPSSFSLATAALNSAGTVLYYPYWIEPLAHWTVVQDDFVQQGREKVKELTRVHCTTVRQQHDNNNSTTATTIPLLFSKARTDRSGASVQDMLMAHAYAFQQNATYGGACIERKNSSPRNQGTVRALLRGLGLESILRFDCPRRGLQDDNAVIDFEKYLAYDTQLWTPTWLKHMKSKIDYESLRVAVGVTTVPNDDQVFRVAVHIRRQDVEPCGHLRDRYLPNQYYLDLLDYYVPNLIEKIRTEQGFEPSVEVTIFSQEDSFESFDDFLARGYSVQLDTDITHVWRYMMLADMTIVSKSSFSLVPAVLSHSGNILYTPFWHAPLQHWTVVINELLERGKQHLSDLILTNCSRAVQIKYRKELERVALTSNITERPQGTSPFGSKKE